VYLEGHVNSRTAVRRERELKGWRREKKVALIEAENPTWEDLAADWFKPLQKASPK
jgi:putative endonuclease